MNILYLCRYNEKRSVIAQQLTNKNYANMYEDLTSFSRGLKDSRRLGITPELGTAFYNLGLGGPITHEPSKVSHEDIEIADIVLCINRSHVIPARRKFEDYQDRIISLTSAAQQPHKDIEDLDHKVTRPSSKFLYNHPEISFRWQRMKGKCDYRDTDQIVNLHMDLVREIDSYLLAAFGFMEKKGIIRPVS